MAADFGPEGMMPEQERQPAPRNYFVVKPARTPKEAMAQAPPHGFPPPGNLTGLLELCVRLLSPLHVGSGGYTEKDGTLVKDVVRRAGAPVLPGSSVKGPVRQIHEALTCSPEPRSEMANRNNLLLSPSARIFGALGYRGRVAFEDGVFDGGEASLVTVNLSVPYPPKPAPEKEGRRFYGRMPEGANQPGRIPALAIAAGTELWTRLRFESLAREELGSVLLALGLGSEGFPIRLGGGKYDDLGWVKVQTGPVSLRDPKKPAFGGAGEELTDEQTLEFVSSAIASFAPGPEGMQALQLFRTNFTGPSARG